LLCVQSFNASACVEHLDFLHHMPDSEMFQPFTEKVTSSGFRSLTDIPTTEQKLASTDDFHVELKVLYRHLGERERQRLSFSVSVLFVSEFHCPPHKDISSLSFKFASCV